MYIVAAFGVLLVIFSIVMIVKPEQWAEGITLFSKQVYFHWFEVISRFTVGIIFIYFSTATQSPILIFNLGILLVLVSCALILIGEQKHKIFAFWSVTTFKKYFRLSGVISLPFGIYIIYVSNII